MLCAIIELGSTALGPFHHQSIKNQKNMKLAKVFLMVKTWLNLGLGCG